MCAELQPTAAIVCTPPNTHAAICIELMNLGIHVLCEKPLAITSHNANRMISAAEHNNVTFTMGSKFRFVEDVQEARRIIKSGKLGDIVLFENTFAGYCDMSQRWNSQPGISGGGVLIDNGTHSIDIMRFLLGAVTELQVVEGRRIQNLDVEDTARLFVRNEAGSDGQYRPVVEHEQGAAALYQHLRFQGHAAGGLEGIPVPVGRRKRMDGLRQWLRQDRRVRESAEELRSGNQRRRRSDHHV